MNNKSIEAIKSDLISLIDNVNNVVNCQKAMDAIAKLEGCIMTKDILEQTRIGKYVNELRKKMTDKNLSKRIKNLVRKWQDVVNEAGIDLNQPFKKVSNTINGKHPPITPSPILSTSQVNGKLKNKSIVKNMEKKCHTTTASPVSFFVTSSPALSDPARSRQSTPSFPLNCSNKNISPSVNNHHKSAFMTVPTCSLTKNKLSVINGHSNKIPNTPPTNSFTCDNNKSSSLAGKKRKSEGVLSESNHFVAKKKLKSSSNNVNGTLNNDFINKLEIPKSFDEPSNQSSNNKSFTNDDSNDIKSSLKKHKNGFVNGTGFEEKVFSCNSTGNLKCKISRNKLGHTPPPIPSSDIKLKSTFTPPIPFLSKVKSTTTPPVGMLRSHTPIPSSKKSISSPFHLASNKSSNSPLIPSSINQSHKPLKKSATASSALYDNFKPGVKHSKVETTAQIVQKLHSNSTLPLSQALESISINRIKRECLEDEEVSVLPVSMKPKGVKKKAKLMPPQSNPQEVAQAKSERMQLFLHSTSSSIPRNNSSNNLESYSNNNKEKSKTKMYINNNNVKSKNKSLNIKMNTNDTTSTNIKSEVKEVDVSKLDPASDEYRTALLKNPWAFLPPLCDLKEEEGVDYNAKEEEEEEEIEKRLNKLSLDKWSGVNGVKDPNGEWRDWTSSFSVKVNNDFCHILPYVCL